MMATGNHFLCLVRDDHKLRASLGEDDEGEEGGAARREEGE